MKAIFINNFLEKIQHKTYSLTAASKTDSYFNKTSTMSVGFTV